MAGESRNLILMPSGDHTKEFSYGICNGRPLERFQRRMEIGMRCSVLSFKKVILSVVGGIFEEFRKMEKWVKRRGHPY